MGAQNANGPPKVSAGAFPISFPTAALYLPVHPW
jgi:hypothetical protein